SVERPKIRLQSDFASRIDVPRGVGAETSDIAFAFARDPSCDRSLLDRRSPDTYAKTLCTPAHRWPNVLGCSGYHLETVSSPLCSRKCRSQAEARWNPSVHRLNI